MISTVKTAALAVAAATLASCAETNEAHPRIPDGQAVRNVVLVHGAFVDGSGWRGVYDELTARGYRVSVVQNPLTSLADDVAATTRVLENQNGPTILVGHSWGGTVITEAGVHPTVAGLVYLSALAPDAGETTSQQYELYPPATDFIIDVGVDGFGFVRPEAFQRGFAADLDDDDAAFPTVLTRTAWRQTPSWAIVPAEDRAFGEGMLLGMAERIGATIVEIPGSHAAFITQPTAVADVIDEAARSLSRAGVEASAEIAVK
jgi:pimeloyl-ACP methyl ester carboxylesterase